MNETKQRIIFLDMMRALAVLLMVQGHTVDTFLADEYRTFDSVLYSVWFTIRGFTAPIFMFTSGVAFTYLLRLHKEPFFENERVKKGFIRFVTLLTIGYLLRYPSFSLISFTEVTKQQWLSFFVVDALHLIGVGLLFILILSYFIEKTGLHDSYVYLAAALLIFILFNFTEKINWANYFPIPLAAYFYHGTGSYFPIFPWAGYVLTGAVMGSYLAHNPQSYKSTNLSRRLLIYGTIVLAFAFVIEVVENLFYGGKELWTDNLYVISLRIGIVLLLNSFMSFIALRLKRIPEFIKQVGRHTLVVYAVHVVILYGSAWLPGLNIIFNRNLDTFTSILAAVVIVVLMAVMVVLIEKFKSFRKKNFLSAEA